MKRFFSKGIVVVAFAAVMVFTVFFAINSKKKHITLVIDGKEQLVETFKETVDEFLIENDIAVIDKDKLNKDNNEVLQKEDKIEITKAVPTSLRLSGEPRALMASFTTTADTHPPVIGPTRATA